MTRKCANFFVGVNGPEQNGVFKLRGIGKKITRSIRVSRKFGVLLLTVGILKHKHNYLQAAEAPIAGIDFLEKAFHEHYEGMHRYAYTILKENEAAKDAVQQVFMQVWSRKEYLQAGLSLKSYFYRAIHNHCLNARSRGTRHEVLEPESSPVPIHPDLTVELKELQMQVLSSIEQLPPQCRTAFLKSREEGKPYRQIANEMGISIKTVEAQVSKALKIMRKALAPYMDILLLALIKHLHQFLP